MMSLLLTALLLGVALPGILAGQIKLKCDGKVRVENDFLLIRPSREGDVIRVTLKKLEYELVLPSAPDLEFIIDSNSSFIATSRITASKITFSRVYDYAGISAGDYLQSKMSDSLSRGWELVRFDGVLFAVLFEDSTIRRVPDSLSFQIIDKPLKRIATCYQYSTSEVFMVEGQSDGGGQWKEHYFLGALFMRVPQRGMPVPYPDNK